MLGLLVKSRRYCIAHDTHRTSRCLSHRHDITCRSSTFTKPAKASLGAGIDRHKRRIWMIMGTSKIKGRLQGSGGF